MIFVSNIKAGGSNTPSWGTRRVVLSGSFNPLHDGHIELLDAACRFHDSLFEGFFFLEFKLTFSSDSYVSGPRLHRCL